MEVLRSVAEFREWRRGAPAPLGFVPTMGYLHAGHCSLIDAAARDCAAVAVSIFVNPTQFGPNEDFAHYPRDEEADLAMCRDAGVAGVLLPSVDDIYPEGHTTTVHVGGVTDRLEGEHRPGHFDGVATVVAKLFNIVQPERAYFGRKDAQQLLVVRRMVRDLHLPVEVIGCPIIRDEDGLALSSRNVYLSPDERAQALSLSRGLRAAEAAYADGVRDAERLRGIARREIEAQPLARIDYVSLADGETLAEASGDVRPPALLSLAVRFGGTRLIDNVTLEG